MRETFAINFGFVHNILAATLQMINTINTKSYTRKKMVREYATADNIMRDSIQMQNPRSKGEVTSVRHARRDGGWTAQEVRIYLNLWKERKAGAR